MTGITAVISAGGASSRMGTDKSFVPLGSKPMIVHVLEKLVKLRINDIFIVTNKPDEYAYLGYRTVKDVIPDAGSLGGIYTALYYTQTPYALVVACDMPFLSIPLLMHMMDYAQEETYDVIVPRLAGYPQALHAIYRRDCMPFIEERIRAERLKIIGFYDKVRVRYLDEEESALLDPTGRSFDNINTPEELAEAEAYYDKQN